MRFSLKPFFIKAIFIALLLCPISAFAVSIEYLYVEANEGNSSGGHSAIQFGDEIYHYQHHDTGLIRLLRQDKQEFHFLYRFLQNRRIHLSNIEVSEQTFILLRDYFKLQFLAQDQQFKQLIDLHKDRVLLRRLLHKQSADVRFSDDDFSAVLRLKGVGIFYADQELDDKKIGDQLTNTNNSRFKSSQAIQIARKKIEQHYGRDFLLQRREQITNGIKSLTPGNWPLVTSILSKDNFPPAIKSFAESYEDYLTGLVAIKVLMEEQPLDSDAYFITQERVTPEQKEVLERLRDQLNLSLIKSVSSGRPDWGYAVLVNMARIIAVDLSLHFGLWVFIDDFAMDSEWISADELVENATKLQIQVTDAWANFIQTQKELSGPEGLTESSYSKLEMAANRYFELLNGKQQKAIRYIGETALPTKSVSLPNWQAPELTLAQLSQALTELDNYESQLFQELAKHYKYDLITRNCVTEIFRTIDKALLQVNKGGVGSWKQVEQAKQESIKRLGGNISPVYNFIPFVSFQSVQDHYKVTRNEVLNSYRDQQLEKLDTANNGVISLLRESNTLTSTVYDYNSDDAFFVFFTDDTLLFRPVFGLFNTAAGFGQSIFGLLSWPFDTGKNLKSGATGVLMSLPELFFFNMRKGSYKYLSYNQFLIDENRNIETLK